MSDPTIIPDNPDADGTDYAHPAWWRGNDAAVRALVEKFNDILDGNDDGSGAIGYAPLEQVRRGVLKLMLDLEEAKKLGDMIRQRWDFHDGPCYYCGEPTNSLAGNSSKWNIPLPHPDDPGRCKPHHTKCVLDRLHNKETK